MLKIVRGFPAGFVINLKNIISGEITDLNDDTWEINLKLYYHTEREDFITLDFTELNESIFVDLDRDFTSNLIATDLGYVLTITIASDDGNTLLKSTVRIPVLNDL